MQAPARQPAGKPLRWRERTVAFALFMGTLLLDYNQRIGWADSGGPNWFAFIFRSDLWFGIAISFGLLLIPRWTLWPQGRLRAARAILFRAPLFFMLAFLLATAVSRMNSGVDPDLFGLADFGKVLMSMCIGLLVFNLARASSQVAVTMIMLLTWAPLMNVIAGLLIVTSLLDPALLDASESGRFAGVAGNPNIVMTQSVIALGFLIPRILRPEPGQERIRIWLSLYAVTLAAVVVWTGVRAALVLLPVVCLIAIWLRLRPTLQSLTTSFVRIGQLAVFFVAAWVIASTMGLTEVLLDRIGGGDGRLFLWLRYSDLLLENPLGLGMTFETVADTESIIEGQRLPPHNTLLLAGMYGGFLGLLVSFFLLGRVARLISRLRRSARSRNLSNDLQGVILAWCALVLSLMFGGLIHGDSNFAILSALMLVLAAPLMRVALPNFRPESVAVAS